MGSPIIVIEHLEEALSPWLILEYRHASTIAGRENLVFTNVPPNYTRLLSRYGRVVNESVVRLVKSGVLKASEVIILDPNASRRIEYEDFLRARYFVVGGILGDHPPRGRTYANITSKLPECEARNIGEQQFSIDGTVYYIMYLFRNRGIAGLGFVDGVTVETDHGYVYLPYRYPLVEGRPLLAPGLEYYIKYRRLPPEIAEEIYGEGSREK
ncbi:hypothetical protein [Thermogladius sp.]|uniref:hypothetical protein n=1 Tax=Thermogladius sp. TaxID=2023064 RepID=UPI003D0C8847